MILGKPPSGGVLRGWRVAGNPRLTGGAVNVPAAQFLSWSSSPTTPSKKLREGTLTPHQITGRLHIVQVGTNFENEDNSENVR